MAVGGVKVIAATVAGPLAKAHSSSRRSSSSHSSSFFYNTTTTTTTPKTRSYGTPAPQHKLHLASEVITSGDDGRRGGGDAAYGGYRARTPTSVTVNGSNSMSYSYNHEGPGDTATTAWLAPSGVVGKDELIVAEGALGFGKDEPGLGRMPGASLKSALKRGSGESRVVGESGKRVLWLEGTTGVSLDDGHGRDADAEGGLKVKFALDLVVHHSTPTTTQLAPLPPSPAAPLSSSQSPVDGALAVDTPASTTSAGSNPATKTNSNSVTTGFGFGPTIFSGSGKSRTSPERNRTRDSVLNRVPEDHSMDFDLTDSPIRETTRGGAFANRTGGSDVGEDPVEDEDSISVLEEELEDQGFYLGSYKRLVGLYTFVPLTAFLFFLLLAWLPTYAYPNKTLPTYPYSVALPFPLPELLTSVAAWSLAHHLREPLYSLGLFISLPFSSEALSSVFPVVFSTTIHAIVSITLRLLVLIVLMIPHYLVFGHPTWEDPSFDRVWWVALGWAAAESIVAIKQGYEAIGLYRDVMIPLPSKDLEDLEGSVRELSQRPKAYGATESWVRAVSSARREESSPVNIAGASATSPPPPPFHHSRLAPLDIGATATERDSLLLPSRLVGGRPGAGAGADLDLRSENAIEVLVDRDLEQLNLIKAREELEDVYGIPFIRIPVFISCLQRVNTFLMSLGIFLLLSSAYIRSTIAYSNDPRPAIPSTLLNTLDNPHSTLITAPHGELIRSNTYLFITLPTLFIIHIIFEIMHTPLVLPKLMVHTAVYIGLLVSLGVFFVGLGMWEALA